MSKNPNDLKKVVAQIEANQKQAPYLSEWKHVKTGDIYVVKTHVIDEPTLEPLVIYYRRFANPHETWARKATEFFDGRFVHVSRGIVP